MSMYDDLNPVRFFNQYTGDQFTNPAQAQASIQQYLAAHSNGGAGTGGYSIGPQSSTVPLPSQPAAPNVQLGQQPTDIMQSLQKILQNPGDTASSPVYKFLQDQGAQMLSRQLGQTGQRFSGNALTEAQQYGQGLAGQYFGQLANTLGNAAQTQLSTYLQPAAAQAGLNLGAYNAGNSAWNNLAQTLLGNYQANVGNASQINRTNLGYAGLAQNQNQFNTQAQASAQGYGQLVPQINNLLASLTNNGYTGPNVGNSYSNGGALSYGYPDYTAPNYASPGAGYSFA